MKRLLHRPWRTIVGFALLSAALAAQAAPRLATRAAADFEIDAAPAAVTLSPESTASSTVSVTSTGGFSNPVRLSATDLPAGVTARFQPANIDPPANGSGRSTLTFAADATAAAGTYPVTVKGTDGALEHTATVQLTVAAASLKLSVAPNPVSVVQGTSGTASVTVTGFGLSSPVTLAGSQLPAGVSVQFQPNPVNPGAGLRGTVTSTMTIAVALSVAPGTYPVKVTGTAGDLSSSAAFNLKVTPNQRYTVAVEPATLALPQASSATATVTVTGYGPINTVTLSATGLPSGVTATFHPAMVTTGQAPVTATLTLSAIQEATPGTYAVQIVGTSGSTVRSAPLNLQVKSTPYFTVTPRWGSKAISVTQGAGLSGWSEIYVNERNGHTEYPIEMTVEGLPRGVTAKVLPVIDETDYYWDVQLTASASAPVGSYPLTLVAKSQIMTQTAALPLRVEPNIDPMRLGSALPIRQVAIDAGQTRVYKFMAPRGGFGYRFDPDSKEVWATLSGTGATDAQIRIGRGAPDNDIEAECQAGPDTLTCGQVELSGAPATYYVSIKAIRPIADATLKVTHTPDWRSSTVRFNTTDYPINDLATTESPLTIASQEGNARERFQVNVNLVHPYTQDLKIELVAPDASVYLLHDHLDVGPDLHKSYVINASDKVANGVWKLRITDDAAGGAGTLSNWSLRMGPRR